MSPSQQSHNDSADAHRVVAATRTISLLTLVSRFAGLVRDGVNSRVFGASPEFSAFTIAFLVPNLFRRLFGEGALSAAFLPRYARLLETDSNRAALYARTLLKRITVVLIGIVLVVEVILITLWWQWHTDIGLEQRTLAIELTMLMFPFMPMVCLTALLGAVLQVQHRFAPTAGSPIVLNLCMIVPALWAYTRSVGDATFNTSTGLYAISIGVLIAGLVQIIWSLSALQKRSLSNDGADPALHRLARRESNATFRFALPMILGLGVLQLNTFMDGLIAAYPILIGPEFAGRPFPLDGQSAAILGFGQRLYQFPLGVFGIAVATAIYPTLARTASQPGQFVETLRHGLRLSLFIALPATIGLMLVSHSLTTVVFQGGAFDAQDVQRVSAVLMMYAPAVAAYSVIHLLTRAFYSLDDARSPVRIAVGMTVLNLALNVSLIWWIGERGLAASTSICAWAQVGLLARKLQAGTPESNIRTGLSAPLLRLAIATLIMSAITGIIAWMWQSSPEPDWSAALIRLCVLSGVGMLVYFVAAKLLRLEELRWLLHRRDPTP